MTIFYKRISFFLVLLGMFFNSTSNAQSATISPYSRYGIGDLEYQNGGQSFAMGQTGVAMHADTTTPFFLNLKNPAAYFYNRITTYEAGILNNNVWMTTEGQHYANNNAYFGYFAIAFPIGKSFSGSFGLRPLSSVGYNLNTTGNIDSTDSKGNVTSIGTTSNQYVGSGGINEVHFGAAYSPSWVDKLHRLSIGGNLNYLFGNLNYTQNVVYSDNLLALNSQEVQNVNIHGLTGDLGAMLTLGRNQPNSSQVILGITYSMNSNLYGNNNVLAVNYLTGSPQSNIDTVKDSSSTGHVKIPMAIGGGITWVHRDKYNNNNITLTFDATWQNWSQFTMFGQPQGLKDSHQLAFGAQYIPYKNAPDKKDFFKRIHYRAGFNYTQTYLGFDDNIWLKDYSMSLGIAVPVGPNLSPVNTNLGILNIGLQAGWMGTTQDNLLLQQYIKVQFSFTFDSMWFLKRLYN